MRKFYLLQLILLSFTSQVLPQETEIKQPEISELPYLYKFKTSNYADSLLLTRTKQIWNSSSSIWANKYLTEYSHSQQNLVDTVFNNKWTGIWTDDGGITYSYDYQNRIWLEYFHYVHWNTLNWYNNRRNHYIYSGNNLWKIDTYTLYDSDWYNDYRVTYSWNSQNLMTMRWTNYINFYGFWCNGDKYEYFYDSDNRLIKYFRYDGYGCNGWALEGQALLTYDGSGNNVEKLGQLLVAADSSWINYSLNRYEYDNNNLLELTTYLSWDENLLDWRNVWRESYTYTQQSLLETVLKENWSVEGNDWENYSLRTISYDDEGNWLEDVTQLWDSTYWLNSTRYLATWYEPVSVNDNQLVVSHFSLSQNYPNPFNPTTQIRFTIPEVRLTTLKVYDVLGNEVFTLVNEEKPAGTYEVTWYPEGLPSGVYFCQLKAGDFVETKKMILLR